MNGLLKKLEDNLRLENYSKETIKGYLLQVRKYLEYARTTGINSNSVKQFLLKRISTKNPASIGHNVFAIKYFFREILHQELNIPNPKRNKTLPEILTIEEIRSMVGCTTNIKHKLIVKLLYGTGLRVSEIINLKKRDLNFRENLIKINLAKGKKDRFVKIPSSIKNKFESYSKLIRGKTLFLSNRGEKLTKKTIGKIVSNAAKKAGIKMPNTYLVEEDGSIHFVVERFDIYKDNEGRVQRKHMHSLSGLMHQNPAETTFDYTNLFRVGEKLNIPYEDKEQFFKTMLFNLIFSNRDDHTRNFSYLMDSNGNWRGAPAYDLTFSTNRRHQMLFDYTNGYELTKEKIIKIADNFGIKNASETIEEMVELKHSYLHELSREYDMKEWYADILESTKSLFQK